MNESKTSKAVEDQPDLNAVLLSWKSPSHPFKKRDRIFYQTVAAMTFLLVVIVFFLHEFMLMAAILAIAFLVYVISTVPPIEVEHKIMPLGFDNAGRLFHWQELYSFWFDERWGYKMIVIQTRLPFPAQIRVVLSGVDQDKVKEIVGKYLLFHAKPQKSWTDNLSDWISQKIPLETSS